MEGEVLKFEAIAVVKLPGDVKEVLRDNELDESTVIGLLTLERGNLVPDTTRGVLRKAGAFITQ